VALDVAQHALASPASWRRARLRLRHSRNVSSAHWPASLSASIASSRRSGRELPGAFDNAIVVILGLLISRELSSQPDERSEAISSGLRLNVNRIA
jgi:hypothetical protein